MRSLTFTVAALGVLLSVLTGCSRFIDVVVEDKAYDPARMMLSETPALNGPVAASMFFASGDTRLRDEPMSMSRPSLPVEIAMDGEAMQDVYFEYDSWRVSDADGEMLSHHAEWLRAHPAQMLLVEGHCDERGSQAYNMVLGEKRARAIRGYLVNLNVPSKQIKAVSYGKERPTCSQATEHCYRENRRGHLVVNAVVSQAR